MTIANTFAAKASVAFVAVAMALSMVAPAQAQTAEELQAQIDTLMATIASLQGTGTTATVSGSAYVFTRPLTIGSQGADVTALQTYLIAGGYSIPAGATGYFGAQTAAAVAAWQTANGVMPAAGYFGPVSQAKYNALMAATPTPTPDEDEDEDEDEDDEDTELQGEASLGDVESQDGDDTSIEEGQEAAPVAEFEVEFVDGDASISRVDLTFVATSASEEDPWDTFEEVSLWVDGDEVATMDASDEDEYLDEDDGSLRFSGLDIVGMEDEPVTIVVAVTVQGSVDNVPADWEVDLTDIRFEDADEVTSTEAVTVDAVDFDIDVEGADDELDVKSSSEDPDATTLQLEDDGNSDWTTVFAFGLDSDDSSNDVELNDITLDVAATSNGTTALNTGRLINDAMLIIDGEEFDVETITHATGTGTFLFELDGDVVIEAGEEITVEFQLEFKELETGLEGATIQASVDGADIQAEGADDITVGGASTGDEHTLRTTGAILELTESESEENVNDDGIADDEGVFTLEFEVTAFESDLFVAKTAASSTATTAGVDFRITNGAGTLVGTTTPTASLSSTADSETGSDSVSRFKVAEGETETFTLTVNYNPGTTGFYGVQIYSLNFKTANTGAATVNQQLALPAEDFESDPQSI